MEGSSAQAWCLHSSRSQKCRGAGTSAPRRGGGNGGFCFCIPRRRRELRTLPRILVHAQALGLAAHSLSHTAGIGAVTRTHDWLAASEDLRRCSQNPAVSSEHWKSQTSGELMVFIHQTLGKYGPGFSDFLCINKWGFGSSLDSRCRSSTTFSKHLLFQISKFPSFTLVLHPNWALPGTVTSQIWPWIHQLKTCIHAMPLAMGFVTEIPGIYWKVSSHYYKWTFTSERLSRGEAVHRNHHLNFKGMTWFGAGFMLGIQCLLSEIVVWGCAVCQMLKAGPPAWTRCLYLGKNLLAPF